MHGRRGRNSLTWVGDVRGGTKGGTAGAAQLSCLMERSVESMAEMDDCCLCINCS